MSGKLIVITAPSGAGKTTIAKRMLEAYPVLEFSVSATTRQPRSGEVHGKDYYFFTEEQFRKKIETNSFVEWEEVYPGVFYGTLKHDLKTIWDSGKEVLLDVDVRGAMQLEKQYGEDALTIFIKPPSIEVLINRLRSRATESPEKIEERISKASNELQFESYFDEVVINEILPDAVRQVENLIDDFLFT
ncbi:MAG: guanylate kinase [Chitinophagales bacterium]|nr:guanylate kinase [Chitinophagales bacterium]